MISFAQYRLFKFEGYNMILSIKTNQLPVCRFIGEVTYNEPWTHFKRNIDEYIIYIIKSGTLYIQENDKKFVLEKNDFFIFEPNTTHFGYKSSTCDYFYIHFQHDAITQLNKEQNVFLQELYERRYHAAASNCLYSAFANDSTCYLPKRTSLQNIDHYKILLRDEIDDYENRLENYKEKVSCELLIMLINISRDFVSTQIEQVSKKNKSFTVSQDILSYLNSNYPNKISSIDIAEIFEGNFDHLNRSFKKTTGHTIFSYLNLIRINKAKELMLTTHMKFAEIGYLVGIDNQYYFSRLFKKIVGATPTDYCKQHYDENIVIT